MRLHEGPRRSRRARGALRASGRGTGCPVDRHVDRHRTDDAAAAGSCDPRRLLPEGDPRIRPAANPPVNDVRHGVGPSSGTRPGGRRRSAAVLVVGECRGHAPLGAAPNGSPPMTLARSPRILAIPGPPIVPERVRVPLTGAFGRGWIELAEGLGLRVETIDFGTASPIDAPHIGERLRADPALEIRSAPLQVDASPRSDAIASRCTPGGSSRRWRSAAARLPVVRGGEPSREGAVTARRGRCPARSYRDT